MARRAVRVMGTGRSLALLVVATACSSGPRPAPLPPPAPDTSVRVPPPGAPVQRVTTGTLAWHTVEPRMPIAVSNNAVAALGGQDDRTITLVSLMGLGLGKTQADIVRSTVLGQPGHRWHTGAEVPSRQGRLASAAVTVDREVWLFGGYTVAPDGHEVSLPQIDIYDPATDTWRAGPTMPTPVDDAVLVRWRDRIGLISGWSNTGNVRDVQWLTPNTGAWSTGTPIPAPGVFGHAGGVLRNTIVVCDGVRTTEVPQARYAAVDRCLGGAINPRLPDTITWRTLPAHPGPARYRMAAGTYQPGTAASPWIVFAGGTATPYNYNGHGYDGAPSVPVRDVFAWDGAAWRDLPPLPEPSMDHRGLVAAGDSLFLIGGMDEARQPTDRILRLGPG